MLEPSATSQRPRDRDTGDRVPHRSPGATASADKTLGTRTCTSAWLVGTTALNIGFFRNRFLGLILEEHHPTEPGRPGIQHPSPLRGLGSTARLGNLCHPPSFGLHVTPLSFTATIFHLRSPPHPFLSPLRSSLPTTTERTPSEDSQ